MLWYEITATAAPTDVEGVADLMRAVAPGGITIHEPVDILGPELGYRVRPGDPVLVRVYVPSSELGAVLVDDLRTRMAEAYPVVELIARPFYEEDWSVSWREFFGVVDYGGRLVIVPSWIAHEPAPGQLVIHLDPGQAFGTGHHETTRLCLAAMEDLVTPGSRVLDVGTGSGVLAIGAALLGAGHVDAVDIDPVSVNDARENCAANGVGGRVALSRGSAPAGAGGAYDLVVANISAPANIELAPAYAAAARPGGALVLSGLLTTDADRVRAAQEAVGFTQRETQTERDWAVLVFAFGEDGDAG